MAEHHDFWFFYLLRVRYSEVDQQGIVYNAHYLTYFDTALTEYMRALDYNYRDQLPQTGTDFHVVRAVVEYKAPARFDDMIEIAVRTARIGRSSITFELAVFPDGGDKMLASGEIVWVNAIQADRSPCPVPPALRELIEAREGSAQA
jgi:acyl-CoA thioester hydrolase